jgi:uncharacterized protein YhdP
LPVIGSIAAGSAVGWSFLLFQKIFGSIIDKAVEIQYTVKGTWDDPEIVQIEKTKPEQETLRRDK